MIPTLDTAGIMQLLYGLFVAVLAAVVYTVVLKFKDDPNVTQPIDWPSLYANIVFGVVVGIVAWATGVTVTIDWLGGQIAAYGVIIALLDHIFNGIINRTVAKPKFGPFMFKGKMLKNPAPRTDKKGIFAGLAVSIRKMDPDSRDFLVFDQPANLQPLILNDVDQAEVANNGLGTYTYAIQAGYWVYIIQDSELTGACHFWSMFGWLGSSNVTWKPISDACLTAIRTTGRFPAYNNLY